MKFIDLTRQRFGKLLVIDRADNNGSGKVCWNCKCDCGQGKVAIRSDLRATHVRSCGCLIKEKNIQKNNLIGQKFNRLTITEYCGKYKYLCLCDCGKEKIVNIYSLKTGHTKSCGCLHREKTIQRNKINGPLKHNCWTKEEDDILKKFYILKGSKYCCNLLDRTKDAVSKEIKKLNLEPKIIKWTNKEIGIIKEMFPDKGTSHCAKLLNKTKHSISLKAMRLNLKRSIPYKKYIVKKLSSGKIIAICQKHGESPHYYRKNKIMGCVKCSLISGIEYRKNPVNNFACRLRSSIGSAFKRIYDKNGGSRKVGAMRHLDYTSRELYNYLENIRKLQNNECPICKINYKNCVVSIDHVIPLATAKTEQQIINLFCLKNLSLMCKNCNSSKNDTDYKAWKDNKREY